MIKTVLEYIAAHQILRRVVSAFLAPLTWSSPRMKAAVLLLEGQEYGWKDFEETGDSQRQFITNLRNLIRTHSSRDAKIAVEDKNKLDELIQKMDGYSRRN